MLWHLHGYHYAVCTHLIVNAFAARAAGSACQTVSSGISSCAMTACEEVVRAHAAALPRSKYSQALGRGFESHHPLYFDRGLYPKSTTVVSVCAGDDGAFLSQLSANLSAPDWIFSGRAFCVFEQGACRFLPTA
jgi:hypothetical protein